MKASAFVEPTARGNAPPAPRFPRPFALILGAVPQAPHSMALVTCLNRLFGAALREGELDFLRGRAVRILIHDLGLRFSFTLGSRGRLERCPDGRRPDVTIDGALYDYLLLATRREDPDTLFFNRRLRLDGDVELGLYVKNFLDAQEPDPRHAPVWRAFGHAVSVMETFARSRPAAGQSHS
jgi:predicted lipid carrier protein YhbT